MFTLQTEEGYSPKLEFSLMNPIEKHYSNLITLHSKQHRAMGGIAFTQGPSSDINRREMAAEVFFINAQPIN